MEQRKLIKLGNSSFAIALPKDWVNKSGLKKGDEIFIEQNPGGELNISSKFKKINGGKEKEIDLSKISDEEVIKREISTAYVQDFNKINILGVEDREKKEIVKKYTNYLIGLEILEDNKDNLVIKDFFDLNEVDIKNFVRRIDNNIRSMLDELGKGIEKGKISQRQFLEIHEADDDINKFYLLVNKLLIKGINNPSVLNLLKVDSLSLFNHWWINYNLEHIGDEIKRIARFLKTEEIKPKEISLVNEVFLQMKNLYSESVSAYYKKDKAISLSAISKRHGINKSADLLSQSKEGIIAKIGEKFKQIIGTLHQINKIIMYSLS